RRHTRFSRDWSSDVCSSDLYERLNGTLSENGGEWYLGQRSFADTFLYVLTRWIEKTPLSIGDYPALKAFRARMEADEGVKQALEIGRASCRGRGEMARVAGC